MVRDFFNSDILFLSGFSSGTENDGSLEGIYHVD